jgi:ubiquinone/menaquinone biosynthesis C-methylase UbiE
MIYREEREIIIPILIKAASNAERILEIGVGRGRIARVLLEGCSRVELYSLDIAHESVKHAPGNRIVADVRSLPFKEATFDFVYSLGVVEHFAQTGEAIREHVRVVRNKGYVFISTPHSSPLGHLKRLEFFVAKKMKRWNGTFVTRVGRHLAYSEFASFLRDPTLRILELRIIPPVTPFPTILRPILGLQRTLLAWEVIDSLAQRVLPSRFGGFIYCLASKSAGKR